MTNKKDENLESLLQQFVDEPQARQMTEDVGYADRLFEQYLPPSAPPEIITAVQRKVLSELEHHKQLQSKIRWFCNVAIVAFALMGLFILFSNAPDNSPSQSPVQVAVSSGSLNKDFSFSTDTTLAEIEQEITRLSEAVNAADADTGECSDSLFELGDSTDGCITVSPEFWKG